jgi:hypothetical protein
MVNPFSKSSGKSSLEKVFHWVIMENLLHPISFHFLLSDLVQVHFTVVSKYKRLTCAKLVISISHATV